MTNLDKEWESFLFEENKHSFQSITNNDTSNNIENLKNNYIKDSSEKFDLPKASEIYISTKTIITYINTTIDLISIFWQIPIINYNNLEEGIIKKQIKINSSSPEEVEEIQKNIPTNLYIDQQIINHIDNPTGRIQFKDVRKISIGICKKDILTFRSKKKSAFYNCFVIIMRIFDENIFKEIHIKVFNTGKLEIPGIQNNKILYKSLDLLVKVLKTCTQNLNLNYIKNSEETVLINSNFNCGFYIDREKLFNILKYSYNINSCYDPCSYPGIQCEFYYNKNNPLNNGTQNLNKDINNIKISFMIFRTGSVLIVGRCTEEILYYIYKFIKNLLQKEFLKIVTKISSDHIISKNKKNKKKTIYIKVTKSP